MARPLLGNAHLLVLATTRQQQPRTSRLLTFALLLLLPSWSLAQSSAGEHAVPPSSVDAGTPLPDAPSASRNAQSSSFGSKLGEAAKTIGEDELHILKSPFHKKAIIWDALVVGSTAVLVANDESVLHQVPTSWHDSSISISNAALGATAATVGGIYVAGLVTDNEHAKEVGIRSAESSIDSVILYAAMKAIFARQRPNTGVGEGKFFAGNWTSGSFPSGHAMLTWTIASTVAHEYHSPWMSLLMYGLATTVSTTRVTARQHFPSDVFVGSVFGYGIGAYVAHKDRKPNHSQHLISRVPDAIFDHITIGAQ